MVLPVRVAAIDAVYEASEQRVIALSPKDADRPSRRGTRARGRANRLSARFEGSTRDPRPSCTECDSIGPYGLSGGEIPASRSGCRRARFRGAHEGSGRSRDSRRRSTGLEYPLRGRRVPGWTVQRFFFRRPRANRRRRRDSEAHVRDTERGRPHRPSAPDDEELADATGACERVPLAAATRAALLVAAAAYGGGRAPVGRPRVHHPLDRSTVGSQQAPDHRRLDRTIVGAVAIVCIKPTWSTRTDPVLAMEAS